MSNPHPKQGHRHQLTTEGRNRPTEHQVGRLRRLLDGLDPQTVELEDVIELRRLLYGLYAVLRLHNAQEEEGAFSLVPDGAANHSA